MSSSKARRSAPGVSPACDNKMVYAHKKDAAQAASRLKLTLLNREGMVQPLGAYHCAGHHGYHIGHPPNWRKENGLPRRPFRVSL